MLAKLLLRLILVAATPRTINKLADLVLTKLEPLAHATPNRVDDEVLAHMRRLIKQCQHGRAEP